MDHPFVCFWEFLDSLYYEITALNFQGTHLHEHLYSVSCIFVEVDYAFKKDALAYDILEVLDALLGPPVVVGGRSSAHNDLAVVSHHVQERTQHVLAYVLVVDITLLTVHHISEGLLELFGSDVFSIIKVSVVNASLAAIIPCCLAFFVSASNTIDPFVAHFREILSGSEANSSGC